MESDEPLPRNLEANLVNLDMTSHVREPIQVYLSAPERAELDRVAAGLGVSRSEALRRGIEAIGSRRELDVSPRSALEGVLTPALRLPGKPPRSKPVAPLADILAGLDEDRTDR